MKESTQWRIGLAVTIILAVAGWTFAITEKLSNSEHSELKTLIVAESNARAVEDIILNDKIDGTPEKLASIQASLNIIMHKLGLQ